MELIYNSHYIRTDERGCIIEGWSDGPHPERDAAGAICIGEQGSYQFRLTPGGEENPILHTADGIPFYKWEGGQALPRSKEEMAADREALPALPPSAQERLRADVDFLAAMGGITL